MCICVYVCNISMCLMKISGLKVSNKIVFVKKIIDSNYIVTNFDMIHPKKKRVELIPHNTKLLSKQLTRKVEPRTKCSSFFSTI